MTCWYLLFMLCCVKQPFIACFDSSRLVTSKRSHPVAIDVDQTYDRAYHSRYEAYTVHMKCWYLLFMLCCV